MFEVSGNSINLLPIVRISERVSLRILSFTCSAAQLLTFGGVLLTDVLKPARPGAKPSHRSSHQSLYRNAQYLTVEFLVSTFGTNSRATMIRYI